ncbi:uncharacterized protein LOC144432761 [Glandiceps talaboti]
MGGACGRSYDSRSVEFNRTLSPHKLARAESSVPGPPEIRVSGKGALHISTLRQHNSSCLHKQIGGDSLPNSMLSVVGSNAMVSGQKDYANSQTPTRQAEWDSRCTVPSASDTTNRMGTTTECSRSDFPLLGSPINGSLCHTQEQETTSVCFPSTRSKGNGGGCSLHVMGGDNGICLSTNHSTAQSSQENPGRGANDFSSGTSLAHQGMVPNHSQSVDCASSQNPTERGSNDTGQEHHSPEPRDVPSSRVSVVEQSLMEKGFSRESAAIIARPQRPSTLATYNEKWQFFCSWCDRKQISPVKVTNRQLADFLLFLFVTKKYSPNTIKVYRSAIAATIKSIGGEDFGQDKILSNMIRHFLLKRPPSRQTVPQWSLPLVLRVLQEPPFEPMGSVSLKALTLKTVFLVALASGRRRSAIHALCISEGHFNLSRTAAVMHTAPGFLAKNQVLGSVPNPIMIKSLDDFVGRDKVERTLCPVRALRWYLDRSKSFRKGRTRLFIPFPPSVKDDCSPADISKWIVDTVKWAYVEAQQDHLSPHRVTAHEVRAIAASWALRSGVPVADILQAGTWRSPNSFISYYLRDMSDHAEDLATLGPLSISQNITLTGHTETPTT